MEKYVEYERRKTEIYESYIEAKERNKEIETAEGLIPKNIYITTKSPQWPCTPPPPPTKDIKRVSPLFDICGYEGRRNGGGAVYLRPKEGF